jgi:hypothetical protein
VNEQPEPRERAWEFSHESTWSVCYSPTTQNDSRFLYHLSCNGLQALRNRSIDVTLLATMVGVPSTAVAWLTRFCSRGFASVVGFYSGHLPGSPLRFTQRTTTRSWTAKNKHQRIRVGAAAEVDTLARCLTR